MLQQLYVLPILLFSVILHEIAHGWMALRCGDPTAKEMGRLTLNPVPHIDLFGSIIIPLASLATTGSVFIAWAKPVPVNPGNFRNFRRDEIFVSAVGPLTNIAIAIVCAFATAALASVYGALSGSSLEGSAVSFLVQMFYSGIYLNIFLAVFNLIPIPPLDGSHVLASLLPEKLGAFYHRIGIIGILLVIVAMQVPAVYSLVLHIVRTLASPLEQIVGLSL
ncbi:MAG: site-2 protease family protein [Bacteroidota bacterium]|nr:site-2 protease family protein [Bacteroidota bacterium]